MEEGNMDKKRGKNLINIRKVLNAEIEGDLLEVTKGKEKKIT
jgi:hypothetical protein